MIAIASAPVTTPARGCLTVQVVWALQAGWAARPCQLGEAWAAMPSALETAQRMRSSNDVELPVI